MTTQQHSLLIAPNLDCRHSMSSMVSSSVVVEEYVVNQEKNVVVWSFTCFTQLHEFPISPTASKHAMVITHFISFLLLYCNPYWHSILYDCNMLHINRNHQRAWMQQVMTRSALRPTRLAVQTATTNKTQILRLRALWTQLPVQSHYWPSSRTIMMPISYPISVAVTATTMTQVSTRLLRVRIQGARRSQRNVSLGRRGSMISIMFRHAHLPADEWSVDILHLPRFRSEKHQVLQNQVVVVVKSRIDYRPGPRKARHGEKVKRSPRWNILRVRCTFSAGRIHGSSLCDTTNNYGVASEVFVYIVVVNNAKSVSMDGGRSERIRQWISHVMSSPSALLYTLLKE